MSCKVISVYENDFHDVIDLLLPPNLGYLSPDIWRKLFITDKFNSATSAHIGVGLRCENDNIVGFIGMIASDHIQLESKVINISSWVVDPGFRKNSLDIIRQVKLEENAFITALTPSPISEKALRKIGGFTTLADFYYEISPNNLNEVLIESFLSDSDTRISEQENKIYKDHKDFVCHHFLLNTPHSTFYVLGRCTVVNGSSVFVIDYASSIEESLKYIGNLVAHVKSIFGVSKVLIPSCSIPTFLSKGLFVVRMDMPWLVKNNTKHSTKLLKFPVIYSELYVLELNN